MKKFPKIVFIGSDNFSFFFLKNIYSSGYNIIGIITNSDYNTNYNTNKKKHNLIIKYALYNKIPILYPKSLLDNDFFCELKKLNPDLQIVVSFKILPKKIWSLPKMGTINIHPSLLPKYRGAAPINWAIINGEKKTGLTILFVKDKIDSGKIISQKSIDINISDTAGKLEEKLKNIGKHMILKVLHYLSNNSKIEITYKKYNKYCNNTYAPKIYSDDCKIEWNKLQLHEIHNKIRGLSPYPTAWTYIYFKPTKFFRLKVFLSEIEEKNNIIKSSIGLVIIYKKNMLVSVKNGFIKIIECQIEGKKRMHIKNFINGIKTKKNIFVK